MTANASPGMRYLIEAGRLVDRLLVDEWPRIRAGAELMAETLARGGVIHAFGTGHSHMLAEELFYRAGGLVRVRAHPVRGAHAPRRRPAVHGAGAAAGAGRGDPATSIRWPRATCSSSRPTPAATSWRLESSRSVRRDRGVRVIAITSLAHATSRARRHKDVPLLDAIADVVIDNGGCVGDAAVDIDGFTTRVAPTSTVVRRRDPQRDGRRGRGHPRGARHRRRRSTPAPTSPAATRPTPAFGRPEDHA